MKIEMKCKCGASIVIEDERSIYINSGGSPDDKGFVFVIQKTAAEWQEFHKYRCYGAPFQHTEVKYK